MEKRKRAVRKAWNLPIDAKAVTLNHLNNSLQPDIPKKSFLVHNTNRA